VAETPDRPLSLLFVCTANICRSAFAEQMTRHLVADDPSVQVMSAGTHGWVDQPVNPPLANELTTRGIVADGFASRTLTMQMVDEADLVLTAAMSHRQFILDDRPEAVWRVYTIGQFARTIADLPDDLRGFDLLRACRKTHKPATREDDVVDPYERGPEAAATAAAHIERLLNEIIPRLTSG
jgi:sulfate adenylyltransferase